MRVLQFLKPKSNSAAISANSTAAMSEHYELHNTLDRILQNFLDADVDEILLNGVSAAFAISRNSHRELTPFFSSQEQMLEWLQTFSYQNGVRLDPLTPSSGGEFQERITKRNFRWHCLLSPVAKDGPLFSIRRHRFESLGLEHFLSNPVLRQKLLSCYHEKHSFVFYGPTGSGKTTLLCALITEFSSHERILVLETLAELPRGNDRWIRLCEQKSNIEEKGGFSMQQLFEESMRLRPDRIVIGEIRGKEAGSFFDALSSGHRGTLTTLHADNSEQALSRLQRMIEQSRPLALEDLKTSDLCFVGMKRGSPPSIFSVMTLDEINSRK